MEKILVLDFGGQYNQLIARRVRDNHVFAEILPYTTPLEQIKNANYKGIIFTGGPNSVFDPASPHYTKEILDIGVPILGIVENMSYFECDECGKKHYLYGESKLESVAGELGVDVLARLPIEPVNAKMVDGGTVELANTDHIEAAVDAIMEKLGD